MYTLYQPYLSIIAKWSSPFIYYVMIPHVCYYNWFTFVACFLSASPLIYSILPPLNNIYTTPSNPNFPYPSPLNFLTLRWQYYDLHCHIYILWSTLSYLYFDMFPFIPTTLQNFDGPYVAIFNETNRFGIQRHNLLFPLVKFGWSSKSLMGSRF